MAAPSLRVLTMFGVYWSRRSQGSRSRKTASEAPFLLVSLPAWHLASCVDSPGTQPCKQGSFPTDRRLWTEIALMSLRAICASGLVRVRVQSFV